MEVNIEKKTRIQMNTGKQLKWKYTKKRIKIKRKKKDKTENKIIKKQT